MKKPTKLGGVIHTYQKFDPQRFPSPTQPPPDMVSSAFEHQLRFGSRRQFTEEELANAIHLDPSQIPNLGPSLDMIREMLEKQRQQILSTYETDSVAGLVEENYDSQRDVMQPPAKFEERFREAAQFEQLYDLERLWYAQGNDQSPFAKDLLRLMQRLGEKYEIDELAGSYEFTGSTPLTVEEAIEVKETLQQIDELLKQIEEAMENAQLAIIDMESLAEFASSEDMENLEALQRRVQELMREMAEQQGLEHDGQVFSSPHRLTAYFKENCWKGSSASFRHPRRAVTTIR